MRSSAGKLYGEIMNSAHDAPLSVLFRKSLILANQIEDDEFKEFIELELNGYTDASPFKREGKMIPDYRETGCTYYDQYKRPFIVPQPELHDIQLYPLQYGIPMLEDFYLTNRAMMIPDQRVLELIRNTFKVNAQYIVIEPSSIGHVLNNIRSTFIDKITKLDIKDKSGSTKKIGKKKGFLSRNREKIIVGIIVGVILFVVGVIFTLALGLFSVQI